MLTYIPAPWIRHGKHIEYSYSLKDLVFARYIYSASRRPRKKIRVLISCRVYAMSLEARFRQQIVAQNRV